MESIVKRLNGINWSNISGKLDSGGFALVSSLLTKIECEELIKIYDSSEIFRKTISMERYRFGVGEYKYFAYPLPKAIGQIREAIYPHLVPVANGWMQALKSNVCFPENLADLQKSCRQHGQEKSTVLILKYGEGGYNTLHQDLYGDVFFPIQLVLFLNEPGEDYQGGEFVLLEQRPRAQSKAIVLQPGRGDMLLFTTNFRPVKSSRGYYRANMKHGVSEVRHGSRHTLGIIFHDSK